MCRLLGMKGNTEERQFTLEEVYLSGSSHLACLLKICAGVEAAGAPC